MNSSSINVGNSRHGVTGSRLPRLRILMAAFAIAGGFAAAGARAQTALADQPLFTTNSIPGNLVLALSVEFPTAVTAADRSTTYTSSQKYLGYFDSFKCYKYTTDALPTPVAPLAPDPGPGYFYPVRSTGTATAVCGGPSTYEWSGNFLNWATMQAVDPFRSALTGGNRLVDSPTITILEKAYAPAGQGSRAANFPDKSLTDAATIAGATPFNLSGVYMHVVQCGNKMIVSNATTPNNDACPSSSAWDGTTTSVPAGYTAAVSLAVRVKVCVPGLIEANCKAYGSNYKPEGLIHQYSQKIRYSAFGYLNDPTTARDGGVLRARMKYVGPTQPVPGSAPITNQATTTDPKQGQVTSAEWNATTGVFIGNPDTVDASASSENGSTVSASGVINYLNQFGGASQSYKRYDSVSELYYAATRYLRNLGNVNAYSDLTTYDSNASTTANKTTMKDGFPVITAWTDPILYSCQKNFVLGIGDTNTWNDKNLPGNPTYRNFEPNATPTEPTVDPNGTVPQLDVLSATNKVGVLEYGNLTSTIGNTNTYNVNSNSAYMAGMAYLFHTADFRADMPGARISTYWLDVLENSDYKAGPSGRNQFYLAAKYGGFQVPKDYSYATNTTPLTNSWWATTTDTLPIPSAGGPRPDSYFVANAADKMVSSLTTAFSKFDSGSKATTTSFSIPLPQVTSLNNSSFSATYDPETWTGELTGSSISFVDSVGAPLDSPTLTPQWTFSSKLAAQLSGDGWDKKRRVVTWNGTNGVPFRADNNTLPADDLAQLKTSYGGGNDSTRYLNYLRGDTTNEAGSTVTGGTRAYRTRTKLIGDVVGSKARPIGAPSYPYSDATNPGYSAFRSTWASRRTVVYVGANDGMLHAINGALVTTQPTPAPNPPLEQDSTGQAGTEMFAYVPRALFRGPSSPSTPNVNGLASLGDPNFVHHYMVNATPNVYDINFGVTPGGNGATDWHSVLIGGLGKGGRSYYAIDVTDPQSMVTGGEAAVAGKVLWEFTDPSLGYTYGEPVVAKTKKYGWVVVFASGYNNGDGQGYFLFVNPRTGVLLDKVSTTSATYTNVGSPTNDAGLAQLNAFIVDATDGTADAIYAGDLLGNVWRLDVTATSGTTYAKEATSTTPANPLKLATLVDASGNAQPVTSRAAIEVHPTTKKRFVMLGTGRLLDTTDISSKRGQSFYAITDGTNAAFNTSLTSPLAFPITRSKLLQATDANSLLGKDAVTFDPSTQAGWYQDLGTDSVNGFAYRVTTDPTTLSGSVAFAATVPNGNTCSPSGTSRVYARNYAATTTTLTSVVNSVASPLAFASLTGNVTDLRYLSVGGKGSLVGGTDSTASDNVSQLKITPAVPLSMRRLNWRELQTVD